jgi:hypothetical protein
MICEHKRDSAETHREFREPAISLFRPLALL